MKKSKSPDDYYAAAEQWRSELLKLRSILQATPLTEEIKWGAPCYTFEEKNVVGVAGFKAYFGLWFHQGALLADKDNVLINAQEGKTKALRQWRMASAKEIRPALIKRYVKEAITIVKDGAAIAPARGKPVIVPVELAAAFRGAKKAGDAFKALSPGLQREYADYIAEAKRADTKARRVEKTLPMITAGKGLHDKYR